jgi:hypothetical protein
MCWLGYWWDRKTVYYVTPEYSNELPSIPLKEMIQLLEVLLALYKECSVHNSHSDESVRWEANEELQKCFDLQD